MRVNPNTNADILIALARTQKESASNLQQVSTGRRVNVPSDDPSAAAVLVGNHARADQADQYLRSITSIQGELQTADATLSSVVASLQRAISLGVQGANGTLSDANRASLADDVAGIQQQLISLANLSFQGHFVFAGTASKTQPFVVDATQASGVRYTRSQLFTDSAGNVFQAINDLIVALRTNSGIDAAVTGVRACFVILGKAPSRAPRGEVTGQ